MAVADTTYWVLDQRRELTALMWPFEHDWQAIDGNELADLPGSTDGFTRVAPSDGNDLLVPIGLPREKPSCRTELAVYRDADDGLIVVVHAHRPADPIVELADIEREEFSCVVQLGGHARGLYYGLDEASQHMCRAIEFDDVIRPDDAYRDWPWDDFRQGRTIPTSGYDARLVNTPTGLCAMWRIERAAFASGITCDATIGFTATRRCYATNELVAWAASTFWLPRVAEMGAVLLREPAPRIGPVVDRIELDYDAASETGVVRVRLSNLPGDDELKPHKFWPHIGAIAISLNGVEHRDTLAPVIEATFPIPDGWNRIELLTGFASPYLVTFQKFTGKRVVAVWPTFTAAATMPSRDDVVAAFEQWHDRVDRTYHGDGSWGKQVRAGGLNISHNGSFITEGYALMCLQGVDRDVYRDRLRALCERAISIQTPDGWLPDIAFDPDRTTPFRCGGFDNGAAGEALVHGYKVLGDKRYLDAARRIQAAYRLYRQEVNQNYAAFSAWHLTELYEADPNAAYLEQAAWYIEHNAARAIDPGGAQDGHNYYAVYGGITLKGLAKLLRVLPQSHCYHATLRDRTVRMCNQALSRQQPSGAFAERNRKYVGFWSLAPVVGLIETARACGGDIAESLRPALIAAWHDTEVDKGGEVIARYVDPPF